MTICAHSLCKYFDEKCVVDNLSFCVKPHEVYGLIGPNGAGKTTTMRMLVGLMQPSSGQAELNGIFVDQNPLVAQASVGFVSGSLGLYERLTVKEQLLYYGQLYQMEKNKCLQRINELAEILDFEHLLERYCRHLSTGEKQRVAFARATIHNPPSLIFDEPTSGLDVIASRFVAEYIRKCADNGHAVLFTTHYMTEAELLCDRIGLLFRGKLVAEGTPKDLKEKYSVKTLEEIFIALDQSSEAEKCGSKETDDIENGEPPCCD